MKQIKQIELIVIILLAIVPFSYGIGLTALCLGTMIYIVVLQENIITEMQRALYNICIQSVTEQVETPDIDQNQD